MGMLVTMGKSRSTHFTSPTADREKGWVGPHSERSKTRRGCNRPMAPHISPLIAVKFGHFHHCFKWNVCKYSKLCIRCTYVTSHKFFLRPHVVPCFFLRLHVAPWFPQLKMRKRLRVSGTKADSCWLLAYCRTRILTHKLLGIPLSNRALVKNFSQNICWCSIPRTHNYLDQHR